MKVVINKCYGGFSLSDEAYEWLIKNKQWAVTEYNSMGGYKNRKAKLVRNREHVTLIGKYSLVQDSAQPKFRVDKDVIECIEELKEKANRRHSDLKIVERPDGTDFTIEEYDGIEWVAEIHETWG